MNVYNLEFSLYYLDVNNIKQKHFYTITSIISQSRLGQYMKFNCPAHLEFDEDDRKHRYPKVELLDQFNRNKVNCMVFDLPYNEKNDELYDKMFIYYSDAKTPYYGYIAYNESTKKCLHRYLIGGNYNELTRVLNEFFEGCFNSDMYEFYTKKYNAVNNLYGLTMNDCPTIKDYERMKMRKTERIQKYEKLKHLSN